MAEPPEISPRYNIAPSQPVAVVGVKSDARTRGLAMMRWGLIPRWANDEQGLKPINARSETAASKPMFRDCMAKRRCLIPATGFYEWLKRGTKKVPFHFTVRGGGLFAMAGLWDLWKNPTTGEKVLTCCVLTTQPNAMASTVHDRMPVIVGPQDYAAWLGFDTPPEAVAAMCRPYPAERMAMEEVGPAVNSVKNDGPECLAPAVTAE